VTLLQVILILLAADAIALAAMLFARRRAPAGSFILDTEQASATINVAGTVLAVLIGFVFLIAFQSYGNARSSAADEASAVTALFHTAEGFDNTDRNRLEADAICYARAVVGDEFPKMASGRRSPLVARWILQLEHTFEGTPVSNSAAEQNWYAETDNRAKARAGRLAEATPLIPTPIWVLLIVSGVVVIGFVLVFADSAERRLTQAMMVVVVTTAITASLLTIAFLDSPYGDHEGSIGPKAMRGALRTMEHEQQTRHAVRIPCGGSGQPLA